MGERSSALLRNRRSRVLAAAAAGGVLSLVAACGGNGESDTVPMQFDDLDGGSPVIEVYAGPGKEAADKAVTGQYAEKNDAGEVIIVNALCRATGRPVSSHPELGETPRKTYEDWILLETDPKITQWATATYAREPEALLAQLRNCEPNEGRE